MIRNLLISMIFLMFAGAASAKTRVVATTPALAALARDVGGELVEVEALVPKSQDPHYADPRPSLMLALNKADLLLVNGLELEVGWLPKLQAGARNAAIMAGGAGYFDASEFVRRLDVPAGKVDRSQGDVHPGGNPHFQLDPRAMARVAGALGQKLAALDPDNRDAYFSGAKAVMARLDALARAQIERFAALPATARRVVSYHRSFPYLYDWLGLAEVATVEPRPGIAPDPGHVAKVLSTLKSTGARAIVQEEYYPTNTSKTLSQLGKTSLVVVAGGPRVEAGQTYEAYITTIAEDVHAALTR
jgi:zinc/manganese transport system substrate-binding protein